MADKLDMGEMARFNNANLKMKTQENTLLAKEIIEKEKQSSWSYFRLRKECCGYILYKSRGIFQKNMAD
ncbi:thymosin beta-10-like [Ovis canadensis]|uniref:thymosin beta-10-like n=1 Tax=Ovis canadensis TaxID=37174 RepID=UPI00375229E8